MKKVLAVVMALALFFTLCGCDRITGLLDGIDFKIPTWQDLFTFLESDEVAIPDDTESQATEVLPEMLFMPNLESKDYSSATTILNQMGLQVELEYAYNDNVQENCVISQSVAPGAEIHSGNTVFLTISMGNQACPYEYSQKLTVTAPSGSSTATATLYAWANGDWQEIAHYRATVGKNGIGQGAEGSGRTPKGIHALGVVLTANNVDTNMEVYRATANTCVIDDTDSWYYNQIMEISNVPSGASYDQIGKGLTNGSTSVMIFIEHNGDGFSNNNVTPGGGSAIGVRGRTGSLSATNGDVDISEADMIDLLSRLDVTKNPVIEIIVE